MRASIAVAILSCDRLFRDVLALALSARGELAVVPDGDGGDGFAAAQVVLLDAAADPGGALAIARELRERELRAAVVVVGLEREDERVVDFIEAGAVAYALNGISPPELIELIRQVLERRSPNSPPVAASVLGRIAALRRSRPAAPTSPLSSTSPRPTLSARERQILALVASGLSNKEVGRQLSITVQTVKNHVHSLLEKLQVHRRRDAVRLAFEQRLLGEPSRGGGVPPAGECGGQLDSES